MNDIEIEELNDYLDTVKLYMETLVKQVMGIDINCIKHNSYNTIFQLEFEFSITKEIELEVAKQLEKSKFSNWMLNIKRFDRKLCYYSLYNKDLYRDVREYNRKKYLKELLSE